MNKHKSIIGVCIYLVATSSLVAATCIPDTLIQSTGGKNITLPDGLISTNKTSDIDVSINDLTKSAQNNIDKLYNDLDNNSPFHGLYIIGKTSQRTTEDEDKTYLGLEWQLFRRGYFEGQRKSELSTNSTLISAYSLQHKLRVQSLDQALYQVKRIQNGIASHFLRQLLIHQTQLVEVFRKRMRAGFDTQQALAREISTLQSIQDELKFYESLPQALTPFTTAALINHIEKLQLYPLDTLEKWAITRSGIEELQRISTRQSTLSSPRWSDNLSLGIYARRFKDYNSFQGNEVGVQIAIPVDGNFQHDNIVKQRTQLLGLQLAADKTRLREQLASLSEQFQYAQDTIRQLKIDYALSLTTATLHCTHKRHVISTLDDTPEKALEKMPITLLRKQRNILVARLDAYRLLLRLQAKVQPQTGETWYSIQ